MSNNRPCVLITRPEVSGQLLAKHLDKFGICSICQPLFDYQPLPSSPALKKLINEHNSAIIIFISVAAVDYAARSYSLAQWQNNRVLAVGPQSQLALAKYHINAEIPLRSDSEGLLQHPLLQSVNNQHIFIVRGDGGRELLKQQLSQRGAHVHYLQTYQRQWRSFSKDTGQQWQNNEINCIVVTSNAILDKTIALMNTVAAPWKFTCLWVVASERNQRNALKLGIVKVVNENGANDEAITTAIRQYGMKQ